MKVADYSITSVGKQWSSGISEDPECWFSKLNCNQSPGITKKCFPFFSYFHFVQYWTKLYLLNIYLNISISLYLHVLSTSVCLYLLVYLFQVRWVGRDNINPCEKTETYLPQLNSSPLSVVGHMLLWMRIKRKWLIWSLQLTEVLW